MIRLLGRKYYFCFDILFEVCVSLVVISVQGPGGSKAFKIPAA